MYLFRKRFKKRTFTVISISLIVLAGIAIAANIVWGPNVTISQGFRGREPSVAVDTLGRIAVVWAEQVASGSITPGIYASFSTDGGTTFSNQKIIGDGTTDQTMTSDNNGNIYAAWQKAVSVNPYYNDIYVTKSADGGVNWDAPTRVSELGSFNDRPWLSIGQDGCVYLSYTENIFLTPKRKILKAPTGTLNFQLIGWIPSGATVPISVRQNGEMFGVAVARNNEVACWRCLPSQVDCTNVNT